MVELKAMDHEGGEKPCKRNMKEGHDDHLMGQPCEPRPLLLLIKRNVASRDHSRKLAGKKKRSKRM